jgi:hypothetical protein
MTMHLRKTGLSVLLAASVPVAAQIPAQMPDGSAPRAGQPPSGLYAMSARAMGLPIDLVVTEVRREPGKSYVSVAGMEQDGAVRILACLFVDLAYKRGFSHFYFIKMPSGNTSGGTDFEIGLTNAPEVDAREVAPEILGAHPPEKKRTEPVAEHVKYCGIPLPQQGAPGDAKEKPGVAK